MIKERKMAPKASGSSSFNCLSQVRPLVPSCLSPSAAHGQTQPPAPSFSFPPTTTMPPLCPQFPHTNSLS